MGFREPQTPGLGGLQELTSNELLFIQGFSLLGDPNADRIVFWDDSAGAFAYLTAGSGLSIVGTTITATGGASLSDGDYGDVTVSGSGTVITIDNDVVTYAKMQNVSATDRLLGRVSASSGDVEEIVFTDLAQTLLDDTTQAAMLTTLSAASRALDNLASVAINTDLLLGSSDGGALGSVTKMWSDLFLASGGVINWNNGNMTLTHAAASLTFAGGTVALGTSPTMTTPVFTGLPTGTGVASAGTVSTLVSRDANANITANNWLGGYTTTATAAGTTTLAVGSTFLQYFTGSTTQTVTLPVASTLTLGHQFIIVNNSTGLVTVNSSGANAVIILAGSTSATITCILTSGTSAASWSASYSAANAATGKKLIISNTITLVGTDGTTMTFPTTSATLARTDAANTFTGASTASAWVLTSPTITTKISPTSDDGAPLGDTTHNFSDLFLATGAVLNYANGNVAITHSSGILTMGTGEFRITTVGSNSASVPTLGSTSTFTNKRITAREQTVTSSSSITPDADNTDIYTVTAQAVGLTINAPTGTPTQGQKMIIRIKDNGTARALTWNATFKPIGVTLPTTTVISKLVYVGCIYNSTASQWDVVAVSQEA